MGKIKRVRVRSDGGWLLATAIANHGWESVAGALQTTRQTVERWFFERVPPEKTQALATAKLAIPVSAWLAAARAPHVDMIDRRGVNGANRTPGNFAPLPPPSTIAAPQQPQPAALEASPPPEVPEAIKREAAGEWDGAAMDDAGLARRLAFEQLRRLARFRRLMDPLDPRQLELDARELPLLAKYAAFAGELTANDHEKIVKSPAWRQIRLAIAKALVGRVGEAELDAIAVELDAIEQSKGEQRSKGRPKGATA